VWGVSRFDRAFDLLKGLTNYETMVRPPYGRREMNLPRTRALLRRIGHPERAYPVLQVAGTKGKGTAATALASMLRAAGMSVGLYTSPHLLHIRERIAVAGRWIGREEFAEGVDLLQPYVEPLRGSPDCPTFFELLTVLALWRFARAKVDAAVLEVGLGGRLDATSAVRPIACLLTQVGLDHTNVLGVTKAEIAREKAGVAKRRVPILSGVPASSAAGRAIAETAEAKGAPLLVAGRDFRVRTGRPEVSDGRPATEVTAELGRRSVRARVPVLGRGLARDAGLAAAVLLHWAVRRRVRVNAEAIGEGLSGLRLPGRVEIRETEPYVVVDGAHNPDSARHLEETLREALPHRRAIVVLGGGIDKDVPATARVLAGLGPETRFVFTSPASHPRAADPLGLALHRPDSLTAPDLETALEVARELAGPEDLIVVAGSMYLAGEALSLTGGGVAAP